MQTQFVGKTQILIMQLHQTTTYGGKNAFATPQRPADKIEEEEYFLD
jgi:hypothetical protein